MSKLPVVSGKDLVKALQKAGFVGLRQKGSHVSMEKREGEDVRKTIVPLHQSSAWHFERYLETDGTHA